MNDRKGRLFVITGPSGTGKGTVISRLFRICDGLYYSVSMTTRMPRHGESEGKSYFFVTRGEFQKAVEDGMLLEYAEYVGNLYGTPEKPVNEMLDAGLDVILEIEIRGAMQIKAKRPDAVMLFIMPPSTEELRRRLEQRGTETPEKINERILKAAEETLLAERFDYSVVNHNSTKSAEEIASIIKNHRKK